MHLKIFKMSKIITWAKYNIKLRKYSQCAEKYWKGPYNISAF